MVAKGSKAMVAKGSKAKVVAKQLLQVVAKATTTAAPTVLREARGKDTVKNRQNNGQKAEKTLYCL